MIMGLYRRCPRCGNEQIGDSIVRCRICGLIHCESCAIPMPTILFSRYKCPNCGTPWKEGGGVGLGDIE